MSKKEKTVLTKTQKRSLFRWFLNGGASLNYERMMSMAYTLSLIHIQMCIRDREHSASSMASLANEMIGDYVYEAFDMPMQVHTEELITKVNDYVRDIETTDGLVLLVDMGSLERMYDKISRNVDGDLVIVNNTTTALVLDIGFSLYDKADIYHITQIDLELFNTKMQYYKGLSQKPNIIVSCVSGEGIAAVSYTHLSYQQGKGNEEYQKYMEDLTDMQNHVLPYLQSFCSLEEKGVKERREQQVAERNERRADERVISIGANAVVKEAGKTDRKTAQQKQTVDGKDKKLSIHERLEINKKIIQEKQGKDKPERGADFGVR